MSKPVSSSGQPIPVAILVSGPNKTKRPTPKRKSASAANQLPWLWIATGGCAVWIVVVLVIAVTSMTREPEQPPRPNAAALAKLGAVEPAFQPANPPIAMEPDVPMEPAPMPNGAAPKLPFRDRGVEEIDAPPPLKVAVEPMDVPGIGGPGNNVFDKRLFADCQQIGTNVRFMRDATQAFHRATLENKMVFIVHLSGNLEDKEFT